MKRKYERTLDYKVDIRRQIISPQRAFAMAKNIFVDGDFKRLREDFRRYKKDEQTLAQNFLPSICAKISSNFGIGLSTIVLVSLHDFHSLASLIADAILRDPQVVQLVARFDDNCLEMKKDWELMSELDKDALIRKKLSANCSDFTSDTIHFLGAVGKLKVNGKRSEKNKIEKADR